MGAAHQVKSCISIPRANDHGWSLLIEERDSPTSLSSLSTLSLVSTSVPTRAWYIRTEIEEESQTVANGLFGLGVIS